MLCLTCAPLVFLIPRTRPPNAETPILIRVALPFVIPLVPSLSVIHHFGTLAVLVLVPLESGSGLVFGSFELVARLTTAVECEFLRRFGGGVLWTLELMLDSSVSLYSLSDKEPPCYSSVREGRDSTEWFKVGDFVMLGEALLETFLMSSDEVQQLR